MRTRWACHTFGTWAGSNGAAAVVVAAAAVAVVVVAVVVVVPVCRGRSPGATGNFPVNWSLSSFNRQPTA